jgi:hypothetical protein
MSIEKANLTEYFETEIYILNKQLQYTLYEQYRCLYNAEADAYRRSPAYKKAKSKEYWSRPKAERDKEALENELAKLDYWYPRRGTNDKHISYSKKVDEDSSFTRTNDYLIGFSPSISKADFFKNAAKKIEKKVTNSLLLSVVDNVKNQNSYWVKPANFDRLCSDLLPSVDDKYIMSFCEQLKSIYDMFGIDISKKLHSQYQNIVTNGCRIEAKILEQNKLTIISVNIYKYKGQFSLLGKRIGDVFTFPNIPLTYQITHISA